jgi:hypothetical protein
VASALELTIEIDHGGPAPIGRMQSAGGAPVEFAGWLQLLEALRTAIDAPTESNEPFPGADR